MSKLSDEVKALTTKEAMAPQEKPLLLGEKPVEVQIGLPKESSNEENRISLSPDAVEVLVAAGVQVIMQKGAGQQASFADQEYIQAGAEVKPSAQEVFACQVVVKIEPPTLDELEHMKPNSILISAMMPCPQRQECLKLMKK